MADALFSVGHVKVFTDTNGGYRVALEWSPEDAKAAATSCTLGLEDHRAIFTALDWIDKYEVKLTEGNQ